MFSLIVTLISPLTESWYDTAYKTIAKSGIEWLIETVTSKVVFAVKAYENYKYIYCENTLHRLD